MLMIRLQKVGKKNTATFRVVVTEKTQSAKKGAIEMLGFWDPRQKKLALNAQRIKHWIACGAGVSDTIHNMLVSQKIIEGSKISKRNITKAAQEKLKTGEVKEVEKPKEKVDNVQ